MSLTKNGFQNFVNTDIPPANRGDRASMNPVRVVLAGRGAFKADGDTDAPVVVGNFAWFDATDGFAYGAEVAGAVLGFIQNELQTVITEFLGYYRTSVQGGFPVTGYSAGDFWTTVAGGAGDPGDTIYADATNGAPTLDDNSGANPDTGFVLAEPNVVDAVTANTTTVAANTGVMTVATVASGVIEAGQNVTLAGLPANVFIQNQISGTPGGAGTYQLNYQGAAIGAGVATMTQGGLVKITRPV